MLQRGMTGPEVANWQRIVGVFADGVFGAQTEAATKQWQAQRGLEPNGIVADLVLAAAGITEDLVAGIDISRVQGTVDWAKVRGAGYRFVIIKTSEGETYLDPRRLEYLRGARSEGIETGVYHFVRLGSDIAKQVELVWRAMGDQLPELGVVGDTETLPTGMSATEAVERIARFGELYERYDVRGATTYSYAHFLRNLKDALLAPTEAAQRVRASRLWLAHYLWRGEGPPPQHLRPPVPAGWDSIDMWQCNGGGSPTLDGPVIPGIGVPCDRNFAFMPLERLRSRWGGLPPLDTVPWWDRQPIVHPPVPLGRPALDEP